MAKDLLVKGASEVSTEVLDLFSADANDGINMGLNDVAIPFISILQSGSPQCKKSDAKYIKGAEEGFIFNTLTQEVVDGNTGINMIIAAYTRALIEWKPRANGGGMAGRHAIDSKKDEELREVTTPDGVRFLLPNGNSLEDTAEYYVLVFNADGTVTQAVLPMSRTQMKTSRRLNALISGIKMKGNDGSDFTPPMYSQVYHLTTTPQENARGSWYMWQVERVEAVKSRGTYEAAKKFSQAVRKGEIKAATDDPTVPTAEIGKEDVPF